MRLSFRVRWFASFDLSLVKKLREETKGGVMACRDALEASGGDYEKAKTAVMSKLKNRDGKVMAEGLVALYADADSVGCVEIACETDFVARGASMARLSASAASVAAGSPSVGEELLARVREAVKAEMTEAARATGERLDVRRAWRTSLRPALFAGSYLHAPSGQARVAAVAVLESSDAVGNLGQRLSVHIAGMRPASAAELLEQQFAALGAGSGTVGDELKKRRAKLIDFVRIEVGEGVEVKSEDYAASVQEVLKGKQ